MACSALVADVSVQLGAGAEMCLAIDALGGDRMVTGATLVRWSGCVVRRAGWPLGGSFG